MRENEREKEKEREREREREATLDEFVIKGCYLGLYVCV